jgi:hypothetical protein
LRGEVTVAEAHVRGRNREGSEGTTYQEEEKIMG